jgi:hypothetical protein
MPIVGSFAGASARAYGLGASAPAVGDFESIATITVGSGGASYVEFTSIPATYSHLQLRLSALYSTGNNMHLRYNNDTTNGNYTWHHLYADGATAASNAGVNGGRNLIGYATNASNPVVSVTDILDYANTSKLKTVRTIAGQDNNGSGEVALWSGVYNATSVAISSLRVTPEAGTISQYSIFALYGVKA